MSPSDEPPVPWRYDESRREPPPREPSRRLVDATYGYQEAGIDEAWRELLHEHMPFQALDESTRRSLIEMVREVDEDLADTYPRGRIVREQAQVMEHLFLTLRLDRYANAPANRGWMNLLRRWARADVFHEALAPLRPLFSRSFLAFYDAYVHGQDDIELSPVPHPWDERAGVDRAKVEPFRKRAQTDAQHARVRGTGVFLDSGTFGASGGVDADDDQSSDTPKRGQTTGTDAASGDTKAGPDTTGSTPAAPNA